MKRAVKHGMSGMATPPKGHAWRMRHTYIYPELTLVNISNGVVVSSRIARTDEERDEAAVAILLNFRG